MTALPCFGWSQLWLQSSLQGSGAASISPGGGGGGQGGFGLLLAMEDRISSLHPSVGLPSPSPGAEMGVQPLASAFGFFLSNSMFHQKADIFGAASEHKQG